MVTDKEFIEQVHLLIHSARLIPKYSPSLLEQRVSDLVIEKFSDTCRECKNVREFKKNKKEQKGFMQKLGEVISS